MIGVPRDVPLDAYAVMRAGELQVFGRRCRLRLGGIGGGARIEVAGWSDERLRTSDRREQR